MKTIRQGTFETNSSSTHAIVMYSDTEATMMKNGEKMLWRNTDIQTWTEMNRTTTKLIIRNPGGQNLGKQALSDLSFFFLALYGCQFSRFVPQEQNLPFIYP